MFDLILSRAALVLFVAAACVVVSSCAAFDPKACAAIPCPVRLEFDYPDAGPADGADE